MIQVLTEKITNWDIRVISRVAGWNGKVYLDRLMFLLTKSGDGYLYIPLGLVLFMFDYTIAATLVPAGILAFVFELPAQKFIKSKFKRKRPFETVTGIHHLVNPPDKFSFPSGHTAGAFIIAVLLSIYYPPCSFIAMSWATGVGISRVYNGVHYPTDVITGAVLGTVSAYTGLILLRVITI